MKSILSTVFLVTVAACGGAGPTESESAPVKVPLPGSTESSNDASYVCRDITIRGNAYFDDQRTYGRFPFHTDPSGVPGLQYKKLDDLNGTSHGHNYLSLMDATVELYEVDQIDSSANCDAKTLVGTAITDRYGNFTWSGTVCDMCGQDDAAYEKQSNGTLGVSIAAKVKLRYCPDSDLRCFSVKQPPAHSTAPAFDEHGDGSVLYELWWTGASESSPRHIFNASTVTLADFHFATTGSSSDLYLHAAMVHQGLAEATRRLHDDLDLDFKGRTYGEVEAIFPMTWPGHGYGHSHEHKGSDFANRICISAEGTGDGDGSIPTTWGGHSTEFHEYGHIINYRAWGGYGKYVDYNYDGCTDDPDCTKEQNNEEFASAAFKENWADFIRRVVLNEVDSASTKNLFSCEDSSYDDDTSAAISICGSVPCAHGDRSPEAVEHVLCDFFDDRPDAAALYYPGADVQGRKDLTGTLSDLEQAWSLAASTKRDAYIDASNGSGEDVKAGIGLCELATQRIARIPAKAQEVRDILLHNGVDCGI